MQFGVYLKYSNYKQLLRCYCKAAKSNKYFDTIILPKTKFPQRLTGKRLTEQNKIIHEKCGFEDLYSWQRDNLSKPEFVLHDGPPYANGVPHMGHAINKVLKDIINRYHIVKGRSVHYIPGWDCHGLPIELKALMNSKKNDTSPTHIRKTAKNFATKTIEEQQKVFESWGVMGDWKKSYRTYSILYIQNQLKNFYKLYEKKLVYRDFKPVYWSPSSRTALAEAELEYNENHKSTAIILKLKLSRIPKILKSDMNEVNALIWTTTPWTLPSNQAVCYNPKLSYSLVQNSHNSELYIVATDLITELSKSLHCQLNIISSFPGEELSGVKYIHPFQNEELPFLPGAHATNNKGTGLVHTAPAHGADDFILALTHQIPVKCMVDESGMYTEKAGSLKGLRVLDEGNKTVLQMLKDSIVNTEEYIHSYPYDWRTKQPVILRASQQWFVDTNAIKDRAIELLSDVKIFPERNCDVYKRSLVTQVQKRPYWCISRQRVWGVPIPVFYNSKTKAPIITQSSITHLCNTIEQYGADCWWNLPVSSLLPSDVLDEQNLSLDVIEKGQDIFDIWFDSGVSWSNVLANDQIADMYLEGVDQFNGWFQSSLMTSVALRDTVPYKSIYVHGFAVDQNGLKMSKSIGNVVDPQDVVSGGKKQQALGIDTMRWWVACHASQNSTAYISPNVLQASQDEVQKIRNTLRFAIGALSDYQHSTLLDYHSLQTVDKYLLHLLCEFDNQASAMYNGYQFSRLGITVINFITNPVSALYYSVIKDRLYCNQLEDANRRSAQYVLSVMLEIVCNAIAPIVPHLVEEIYMHRTDKQCDTFFKSEKMCVKEEWYQPEIAKIMEIVLSIKKDLNKQVTNISEMEVGLSVSEDIYHKLQVFERLGVSELVDILQVADLSLGRNKELVPGSYNFTLSKSTNERCIRCKKYNSLSENHLCSRCCNVVNMLNKYTAVI